MTDAPERIRKLHMRPDIGRLMSEMVEYVRADLHAAALAEKNAEIAALRAENERWQRVAGGHLDCAMADIAEIARLRAGITAAVEGRYLGCRDECLQCLRAHLRALLDPPPAPDGGEA